MRTLHSEQNIHDQNMRWWEGVQAYMAVLVEGVELVRKNVEELSEPVGGQVGQHILQGFWEPAQLPIGTSVVQHLRNRFYP